MVQIEEFITPEILNEQMHTKIIRSVLTIEQQELRILLTQLCDAKCPYCNDEGQGKVRQKHSIINADWLKNLIMLLADNNVDVKGINLSGGEPTLFPNIQEIGEVVDELGIQLQITTHGNFTDGLRKIMPYLYQANVSIDSLDARKYYSIKKLHLETTLQNIQELKSYGVPIIKINTPFTNFEQSKLMLDYACKEGFDIKFIEILDFTHFGNSKLSISRLDEYLESIGAKKDNFRVGRSIWNYKDICVETMPCLCRAAVLSENPVGFCKNYSQTYVTTLGHLQPCVYSKHTINVYEEVKHYNSGAFSDKWNDFAIMKGLGPCVKAKTVSSFN